MMRLRKRFFLVSLLVLLTVFGTLFPFALRFEYKHLQVEYIYVPADNNTNEVEYPSIINPDTANGGNQ